MKNKELSKVEKLIRFINEEYQIHENEIYEIRIENFVNEAIIGIRENKEQEFKNYTVLRKKFESKYNIGW